MTDIAVHKDTYAPPDRAWLLFEADGVQGPIPRSSGVIDFSTFTKNTHYPDGYLPSGMGLFFSSDKTRLVAAGSTGAGNLAGLLFNATQVPPDTDRKVAVALVDSFAVVSLAKLPANNGVSSGAQANLPLVKFRA
jgi:hypothetical protein